MSEKIHCDLTVPIDYAGMRLDQALAKLLPQYSRTQIQIWIKNQNLTVDAQLPKSKQILRGGEKISLSAQLKTQPAWEPQSIPLDIIFEDEALLVVNKPIGLVVHPAVGNPQNTLLNALLHHVPSLQQLPRAGIIHRLDKNTSGLLIIAKTSETLMHLTKQLKARAISRIYQAVVNGVMTSGGKVDEPIGRHPLQRKKMAVTATGKNAITHYRVIERYRAHTRIKVQLETGRTHQIRVHMAHVHFPIFGDPTYGQRLKLPKGASAELISQLRQFKRQALHASELEFIHPITQKNLKLTAPLPADLKELIEALKNDSRTQ